MLDKLVAAAKAAFFFTLAACALILTLTAVESRKQVASDLSARLDRIEGLDGKVSRIDRIETKLTGFLDKADTHLAKLDERMASVEGHAVQAVDKIDRQMTGIREDVRGIADKADRQVNGIREDVNKQLSAVTVPAGSALTTLDQGLKSANPKVQNILDVSSENFDLLGRCATVDSETGEVIGNPDCFANRLIPTMKSFEQASTAVAKETPAIAQGIRDSSQSTAKLLGKFAQPTPFYKKLLSGGTLAVNVLQLLIP
jgi:uncharacterized protein YoxC